MNDVTFKLEDNLLTVYLKDRLDTTNVQDVSTKIDGILNSNSYQSLVLDIEKLEYLSSAGLREVLKLKKNNKDFKVINASLEVYDIFDMTGFTDIMDVEKAFRKFDCTNLPVIGKGAKGVVYRYNDDTVIKVYNKLNSMDGIYKERELARKAFVLGVPTAISYDIVKVGDKFGSIFELLESKSMADEIKSNPSELEKYADIYTNLLKTIHENSMKENEVPLAISRPNLWVEKTRDLLGSEIVNKYNELLKTIENDNKLVHMDFHINNVLMQNKEALLIDMDTLAMGSPILDLAVIYTAYKGFEYIDSTYIENFFNLDIKTCNKFYDLFIKKYFKKDDTKLEEDKIELLGLLRVVHTLKKRKEADNSFYEQLNKITERMKELFYITDLSI